MRSLVMAAAVLGAAGCVSIDPTLDPVESANYSVDPAHAFLTASVEHFGLSDYTIAFTDFDAQLDFDADAPTQSRISLQINPMGLETNHPDPDKKPEWEERLSTGGGYLNGDEFPVITFVSTAVRQTGETTGEVTGDLNFRGKTQPVTLQVTYNGTATTPLDGGRRRIGFNASGEIDRTDFGADAYTQFVSETVTISFSGEFLEARND